MHSWAVTQSIWGQPCLGLSPSQVQPWMCHRSLSPPTSNSLSQKGQGLEKGLSLRTPPPFLGWERQAQRRLGGRTGPHLLWLKPCRKFHPTLQVDTQIRGQGDRMKRQQGLSATPGPGKELFWMASLVQDPVSGIGRDSWGGLRNEHLSRTR